jgi:hypothetical protein
MVANEIAQADYVLNILPPDVSDRRTQSRVVGMDVCDDCKTPHGADILTRCRSLLHQRDIPIKFRTG